MGTTTRKSFDFSTKPKERTMMLVEADLDELVTCDGCHEENPNLAPMFNDATWRRLGKKHETLCSKCAFDRAIDRKVDLTFADLLPCVFNLFYRPDSWFDMFLSVEPSDVQISKEWHESIAEADRWDQMRAEWCAAHETPAAKIALRAVPDDGEAA
jgi:hypothetical protein